MVFLELLFMVFHVVLTYLEFVYVVLNSVIHSKQHQKIVVLIVKQMILNVLHGHITVEESVAYAFFLTILHSLPKLKVESTTLEHVCLPSPPCRCSCSGLG